MVKIGSKIGVLFIGLLSFLLLINTCSAAVELNISEGTQYVSPGETVNYTLIVSLEETIDETVFYPITEEFSIDPTRDGWIYSFSKDNVILDNISRTTNTSVLQIKVPSDASAGLYSHTVYATGYDSLSALIGIPVEVDFYVINTGVNNIPEFPSVAVPMVAILGIVAFIGRRKE